ncbi:MAG: Nif3-like dinuclear metal center hexameric protein [Geobacteraceae bacterium]|nr:Nif3-like dinuclear metal center hexameric protein [Geobacteraceae bacterium]
MTNLKLSDITGIINKKYPFALAEEWDNVGLQLGNPATEITRIMVALDPLPQVITSAINSNCDLLITHHPLIFSPLRQITSSTTTGSSILKAAQNNLALLAMHTNYDIAQDGLNDLLAKRIGLEQTRPLKVTGRDELIKLVVFVPEEQLATVRAALLPHTESIGNYQDCSFSTAGEGTFLPLAGAQPTIGTIGKLVKVAEQRLELLLRRDQLSKAIRTLLAVHPYEEPAFDCYPLLNEAPPKGLGRIGSLTEPVRLADWAANLAERLECRSVRFVGDPAGMIQKIALCSGSGASLLRDAIRAGADLLLTGDVKYHEAREAEAQGIALVDAGHFGTEILMVAAIRDFLTNALHQAGHTIEILTADCEQDPFRTITRHL